jgi:gamma-glutamyltranspeptidase / glutathione hydrolase
MRNFELPGRSPVHALQGMAATSHPYASMTAIDVLKGGGNAIDAAVAACAVLCVVEPQSTGIGGDCFVLFSPQGSQEVIAYNGSGRAPAAANIEWFENQGIVEIERHSAHAVTIPGTVDAWSRLVEDYGRKSLGELLAPAIQLASEGYPIHSRVAFDWHRAREALRQDVNTGNIFLPKGRLPQAGSLHMQKQLARTLAIIAEQGRDGFYKGSVADDMTIYLNHLGGLHTRDDFAAAQGEYVDPIQTAYRGYHVYECPPNGQGLTALILLNVFSGYSLDQWQALSVDRLHLEIEATKLAYLDRNRCIADPSKIPVPVKGLLSKTHAQTLRAAIDMNHCLDDVPFFDLPRHADTVYLCVVDKDRNVVSFINSLFHAFGSGLTAPHSGVLLQSRGVAFSLDRDHPNCIAPHKRPMHTIIPGMLIEDRRPVMPFGVMGGQYQATGHAHFLSNFIDYQLDVQASIDMGRVFPLPDGRVEVEAGIPADVVAGLRDRGHRTCSPETPIGGAQAIWIDWDTGVLTGGSDPRKDGCVLGY